MKDLRSMSPEELGEYVRSLESPPFAENSSMSGCIRKKRLRSMR